MKKGSLKMMQVKANLHQEILNQLRVQNKTPESLLEVLSKEQYAKLWDVRKDIDIKTITQIAMHLESDWGAYFHM